MMQVPIETFPAKQIWSNPEHPVDLVPGETHRKADKQTDKNFNT